MFAPALEKGLTCPDFVAACGGEAFILGGPEMGMNCNLPGTGGCIPPTVVGARLEPPSKEKEGEKVGRFAAGTNCSVGSLIAFR